MLTIKNLHKEFGGIKAVNSCSFEVPEGKIVALIGPNGAGKTTVFNLITGFIQPDKGKVSLDNQDITNLKPCVIAQSGVSRTFQIIRLFKNMTALENLLIAMPEQMEKFWHALAQLPSMKKLERSNITKAMELLEFVGLKDKANSLAKNLSYGQQKLLEIAKALAPDPKIILLDEPASGVNPTMLKNIKKLLKQLNKKGKTIFFIEHNMDFVMDMAHKVIVLDYGEEIAAGTPEKIRKNRKVIDAYLGVAK